MDLIMTMTRRQHMELLLAERIRDFNSNPDAFRPASSYDDLEEYAKDAMDYLSDLEAKLYAEGRLTFMLFSEGNNCEK